MSLAEVRDIFSKLADRGQTGTFLPVVHRAFGAALLVFDRLHYFKEILEDAERNKTLPEL